MIKRSSSQNYKAGLERPGDWQEISILHSHNTGRIIIIIVLLFQFKSRKRGAKEILYDMYEQLSSTLN